MSNLSIPDSVPARPGASAASANDLRGRHQSATLDMSTGRIVVETKGVQKADAADIGTGSPVFSKIRSSSGTIETANLDTIVTGPSMPGDGMALRHALAAGRAAMPPGIMSPVRATRGTTSRNPWRSRSPATTRRPRRKKPRPRKPRRKKVTPATAKHWTPKSRLPWTP